MKERNRFSKKIVISTVVAVVVYTAVHLVFVWFGREVPPQLTISWFTFWGVEMIALAWRTKGDNKEEINDGIC